MLPKCAKSSAAEAIFSNFKGNKGVCVSVQNTLSLEKLFEWYFDMQQGNILAPSKNSLSLYMPDCIDLENTYQKYCQPNEEISEDKLFDLYEQNTDKELMLDWRNELNGKCFK